MGRRRPLGQGTQHTTHPLLTKGTQHCPPSIQTLTPEGGVAHGDRERLVERDKGWVLVPTVRKLVPDWNKVGVTTSPLTLSR